MAIVGERIDLKQLAGDNKFTLLFAFTGLVLGWFFWWTFNGECSWLVDTGKVPCSLLDAAFSYFGIHMVGSMLSFFGALAFLGGLIDAMLARNRRDKDTEAMNNLLREFIKEQREFNKGFLEALNGIREAVERIARPPADP